jgi:hypothetical protein
VEAVSTPLPCGPPAIQFTLSITISFVFPLKIFVERLSAAGCLIAAYTACAFCCFAAVGANAFAVIDKGAAVYATRLTILAHPLRLCHN